MASVQVAAVATFLVAIALVVTRVINSVVAALLGVVAMVLAGVMSDLQAFGFIDWNVIAILVSVWIIATYFGKTGIPEFLAAKVLAFSRGNVAVFVTLLGTLSGFISMFVDNVVVVLMMAPVLFHIARQFKFKTFGPLLFVGLCANFMGTALLLGDLPPQMLHSVSGIEFGGFVWHSGRPSSFIILTITYLIVVAIFYRRFRRQYAGRAEAAATADVGALPVSESTSEETESQPMDKRFGLLVCGAFAGTIVLMSLRHLTGYRLGFLALVGAVALMLMLEVLRKLWHLNVPSLEELLAELQWDAIFFYAALFALVGGLEHAGIIKAIADALVPYLHQSLLLGTTLLYWVTAPIVGIVEHDAYILTMLYVIRDLAATTQLNPWPLYWALLWAGTLGSNLTVAGAPALFVAVNMAEKEDGRKVDFKEFLGWSGPFVLSSLAICFVLAVVVWVLPFAK
ncbi:MAG: SLC13 family permease [Clostridia bacterium]|jgi:Na+/H+ antiporter NhaD/arsenite permease-like protein|nr:SLC13 family permease [Clostridia bacterium]MDH7573166.1 SLC13 family permease [Clostridia bacterium]